MKAISPASNNASGDGKVSERIFDSFGRLEREKIKKDGVDYNYVRYEYPTNQIQSKIYTVITAGAGEVLSESWTDGAGRVRQSRTELPTNYSGSLIEYDILGRVSRSTVPTEINSSWQPTGDDYRGLDSQSNPVWLWNSAEYDWKGRTTRQINTDGTDKIVSYEGCGCAGNQITTVKGEEIFETDWQGNNPVSLGRRTQKSYQDILGRTVKTQLMNFNGTSTYLTTDVNFNGRDQATTVTRTDHAASQTQITTMTYDGHGRLKRSTVPNKIRTRRPFTTTMGTTASHRLQMPAEHQPITFTICVDCSSRFIIRFHPGHTLTFRRQLIMSTTRSAIERQ